MAAIIAGALLGLIASVFLALVEVATQGAA